MKQYHEPLERILHLRLLDEVAALEAAKAPAEEWEPLLIELAQAVNELPYNPLRAAFLQVADALADAQISHQSVVALAPLIENEGDWEWGDIREKNARLIHVVAPHDETARHLCQRLLESENLETSGYAALGLARSNSRESDVWKILAESELTEVHEFLPDAPESVLEIILPWLSHESVDYHEAALDLAEAMGRLEQWHDRFVGVLVPQLKVKESYMRLSFLKMLVRLKHVDEKMVPLLMKFVTGRTVDEDDEDSEMLGSLFQFSAADLLAEIGQRDERVPQIGMEWASSPDASLRSYGTRILKAVEDKDEESPENREDNQDTLEESDDEDDFDLGNADEAAFRPLSEYEMAGYPLNVDDEDDISVLVEVPITGEGIIKALLRFTGFTTAEIALPVCRKVLEKQTLTDEDCLILHDLVRWRDEYEDSVMARHRLFDWLFLTYGSQN